jgi:hypothetical protein
MLDKSVTREGTMLIKGGIVYLDGWEIDGGGMCREVAALACLYMAKQLQERGLALIEKPGGDRRTSADMPDDTPREWLCEQTREFLKNFEEVPGAPEGKEPQQVTARALLAALTELVECKDLKDRLDRYEASGTAELAVMAEEYQLRKPMAWDTARRLVAKSRAAPPPAPPREDCEHEDCVLPKGHEGEHCDLPF